MIDRLKRNLPQIPPLDSTAEIPTKDKVFVCKFYSLLIGWTWYVVEGEEQEDGDYLFYGLVDGFEREWGYFSLSELEDLTTPRNTPIVERDLLFQPVKVSECIGLKSA